MNKNLAIIGLGILVSACDAQTSDDVQFNANQMVYEKDTRTGICYGAIASRKSSILGTNANMTGIGITVVPCEKVEKFIKKD